MTVPTTKPASRLRMLGYIAYAVGSEDMPCPRSIYFADLDPTAQWPVLFMDLDTNDQVEQWRGHLKMSGNQPEWQVTGMWFQWSVLLTARDREAGT